MLTSTPTPDQQSLTPNLVTSMFGRTDEKDRQSIENDLLRAKLGPITGLFQALRARHEPTAAHSLRVAMGVSSWGLNLNMHPDDLELLEVAAMMHDIGKVGLPDRILLKPSNLAIEERSVVQRFPSIGIEILSASGACQQLLEAIYESRQWYNRTSKDTGEIPTSRIAGQMIAIADAYDSMISDQIYRPAINREQAMVTLFQYSGTQFNPALVKSYADCMKRPIGDLDARISARWMHSQRTTSSTRFFDPAGGSKVSLKSDEQIHRVLQERLVATIQDGILFVDCDGKIGEWNPSAERITGYPKVFVVGQPWSPTLFHIRDSVGRRLRSESCPILLALEKRETSHVRLELTRRDGNPVLVDAHILPLLDDDESISGVAVLFRDATNQVNLEARVEDLHKTASQDPLTKVNNRAELNRRLPLFVEQHQQNKTPGSLIICDIDFFKRINDTYGHQAGDEALILFASILQDLCRANDVVARYGGEEFVILCPECDLSAAVMKAETIRRELQSRPMPSLKSACISASFGVAQVNATDTEESFLGRADRALLMAKEGGRNQVVQLGGEPTLVVQESSGGWFGWFGITPGESILECDLITHVPKDIAIEKLKGFVADLKAEILTSEKLHVTLRVDCRNLRGQPKDGERPTSMFLNIGIESVKVQTGERNDQLQVATLLSIKIRANRQRDRRSRSQREQAERLRASFQSYLVAEQLDNHTRERMVSIAN